MEANMDIKSNMGLGISSAVGGIIAALADLLQKEQASAMLKIKASIASFLGIPFSSMATLLLVVGLGVMLCFIFKVDTTTKAFYAGASVLSVLMTFVPYKLPVSTNTAPSPSAGEAIRPISLLSLFSPHEALAQPPSSAVSPHDVQIHLHLMEDDGRPVREDAVLTLREEGKTKTMAQSKFPGSDFEFYVAPGEYTITIEAKGYRILQEKLVVRALQPQRLDLKLRESGVPLGIQKFFLE